MKENEVKYNQVVTKYKEVTLPGQFDDYKRPKVIRVARQSDAENVTDEDTGVMRWSGGPFLDNFVGINAYITDEEYDNLNDDDMYAMAKKMKLF